jgi:hypothetical protein
MRQHAETPLEVWTAPGLVHLLRVLQEAQQLAVHGWDHPSMAAMLQPAAGAAAPTTTAAAAPATPDEDGEGDEGDDDPMGEDDDNAPAARDGGRGRGGASSSPSRLEPKALLKLRLALLDAHGLEEPYLILAMRGRLWGEAVGRLLSSKDRWARARVTLGRGSHWTDACVRGQSCVALPQIHPAIRIIHPPPPPRSKLQQGIRLLPQHIRSLAKRVTYIKRLVESEGLPAGERLELVARLMLDMRWG